MHACIISMALPALEDMRQLPWTHSCPGIGDLDMDPVTLFNSDWLALKSGH